MPLEDQDDIERTLCQCWLKDSVSLLFNVRFSSDSTRKVQRTVNFNFTISFI